MKELPKEIFEAIEALKSRKFYTAFPEFHKAYPEEWMTEGKQAFEGHLGNYFKQISFGKKVVWNGEEDSPISLSKLNVKYPCTETDELIKTAKESSPKWANTTPEERVEVLWNALQGFKRRFFEVAHATMHTTGQSFMMAFQASGPHAADRALESIALGYQELKRVDRIVEWEKPMGRSSVKLKKEFRPIPKGIGLVIGCSTFPVWNSFPGIFANLVCGNAVIVKPHPKAILPIAIAVAEIQNAFEKLGFPRALIQLAADTSSHPITKKLAEHKGVNLIDYTGNSTFGNYIETLKNKTVFTEKSAINPVIIDSTNNLNENLQNLAFSMLLYSGQMCTSPQNIYISDKGVKTPERQVSYPEVVKILRNELEGLINHPKIGIGTMANIQNEQTIANISAKAKESNNKIENAVGRVSAPVVLEVDATNKLVQEEVFGPFFKVVKTMGIDHSLNLSKQNAEEGGAISCLVFCNNEEIKDKIKSEMEAVYTPVTFNLKGNFWVNQHAAFSDFHVTSGNPSGNASFTNPNFINQRFIWVGHREMIE